MRISDWCSYLCSSDLAFLYLDARYQSRANLSYSATTAPDYFQDGYALVNGRIGIGDIDGRITLEAWARNLFNKRAWTGIYQASTQTGTIAAFIDRKCVVSGKGVSVRGDPGGRRLIKKKKKKQ